MPLRGRQQPPPRDPRYHAWSIRGGPVQFRRPAVCARCGLEAVRAHAPGEHRVAGLPVRAALIGVVYYRWPGDPRWYRAWNAPPCRGTRPPPAEPGDPVDPPE